MAGSFRNIFRLFDSQQFIGFSLLCLCSMLFLWNGRNEETLKVGSAFLIEKPNNKWNIEKEKSGIVFSENEISETIYENYNVTIPKPSPRPPPFLNDEETGDNKSATSTTLSTNSYANENATKAVTELSVNVNQTQNNFTQKSVSKKVLILIWTDYYGLKVERFVDKAVLSGRIWDDQCCKGSVEVTADKDQLDNATSVVFFNYPGNLAKSKLPPKTPTGQLWVHFSKESPTYSAALNPFRGMFNWTMSYRRDSDIWAPYGEKLELDQPLLPEDAIQMPGGIPLDQWIANKTKLLVWVSSNCKTRSKREQFTKALRKEDPKIIDVFGNCGKGICARTNEHCNHTKFWNELASSYKFYFAAENSLCVDYITEKFWRTLDVGMVPVVYGGADYVAVAPPNSYIDVRDFKSPQELIKYLKRVSDDPKEYARFFEWRRVYKVQPTDCWKGWCELCRRTVQYKASPSSAPVQAATYDDLNKWWNTEPLKESTHNSTKTSASVSACKGGPLLI